MARSTEKPRNLRSPLVLSVLLHLLILPLLPLFFSAENSEAGTPSPMKVRVFPLPKPQNDRLKGQIVDVPNSSSSETPNQSQYLSDRNRTVTKQTQSRYTGPNQTPAQSLESKDTQEGKLNLDLPKTFLKEMKKQQQQLAALSPKNYLPEVSFGDETLLNTKEFAYSSFYVRMKRQIEMNWSPQRLQLSALAGRDQWTTVIQFTLTKYGDLANMRMLRSSGNMFLDQEALKAIKASAPFLNPPTDLIEPDGKIRRIPLMHFIVNTSTLF